MFIPSSDEMPDFLMVPYMILMIALIITGIVFIIRMTWGDWK